MHRFTLSYFAADCAHTSSFTPFCQPSHCVDRAGWHAKMASIEFWIPWRHAHGPRYLLTPGCMNKMLLLLVSKFWTVYTSVITWETAKVCSVQFSQKFPPCKILPSTYGNHLTICWGDDLNYTYQNQTLSSSRSFWVLCELFLSFPSFSFCLKLNHFVRVSPSTSSLSWASVFSISLRSPWLLSHLLSEMFASASALIWHRHFLEWIHFSHSKLKYRKVVYKSRTWLDAALK